MSMCWVPPPFPRIGCAGYLPLTLNLVRAVSVGPPGQYDVCTLQLGCMVDWCLTSTQEMKRARDNWGSNQRENVCLGGSQCRSWWVEDPGVFLVNRNWAMSERDRETHTQIEPWCGLFLDSAREQPLEEQSDQQREVQVQPRRKSWPAWRETNLLT